MGFWGVRDQTPGWVSERVWAALSLGRFECNSNLPNDNVALIALIVIGQVRIACKGARGASGKGMKRESEEEGTH